MRIENKVAVVTGASSGVGREIALLFAKEGAKVVAVARRKERLVALEEQSKELAGEIVAYAGDISLEETNEKMIDFAIEKFGKFDILINNAGSIVVCPTTDLQLKDWQNVVDTSITAYFLMSREVGKHMIANHYGRIINIASMYGCIASHHNPILAYNATKGAVPNFTRGLAQEWAEHGITVNAVGPGMFPSEMMNVDAQTEQFLAFRAPIGRAGKIEELCGQILLFASEINSYTTGQTIYIDGGITSV